MSDSIAVITAGRGWISAAPSNHCRNFTTTSVTTVVSALFFGDANPPSQALALNDAEFWNSKAGRLDAENVAPRTAAAIGHDCPFFKIIPGKNFRRSLHSAEVANYRRFGSDSNQWTSIGSVSDYGSVLLIKWRRNKPARYYVWCLANPRKRLPQNPQHECEHGKTSLGLDSRFL
ncbi:hypothetical protein BKA93DRAFT_748288 [Sparassis latifolia]